LLPSWGPGAKFDRSASAGYDPITPKRSGERGSGFKPTPGHSRAYPGVVLSANRSPKRKGPAHQFHQAKARSKMRQDESRRSAKKQSAPTQNRTGERLREHLIKYPRSTCKPTSAGRTHSQSASDAMCSPPGASILTILKLPKACDRKHPKKWGVLKSCRTVVQC